MVLMKVSVHWFIWVWLCYEESRETVMLFKTNSSQSCWYGFLIFVEEIEPCSPNLKYNLEERCAPNMARRLKNFWTWGTLWSWNMTFSKVSCLERGGRLCLVAVQDPKVIEHFCWKEESNGVWGWTAVRKWRTLGVRVFVDAEGIKDCFFYALEFVD